VVAASASRESSMASAKAFTGAKCCAKPNRSYGAEAEGIDELRIGD
jgi:hypothetical protein